MSDPSSEIKNNHDQIMKKIYIIVTYVKKRNLYKKKLLGFNIQKKINVR